MAPNRDAVSKKQILIDTATQLFSQEGYHAIGVDRIVAESGVAKMTLYNHFASKSDLVVAVLAQREAQAADSLREFVARYDEPFDRIRAIFEWHEQWFKETTFTGCMFVNAASEFPGLDDQIHRAAALQKEHLTALLHEVLEPIVPTAAAGKLAEQFLILVDGATVTAQISGNPDSAMLACEIAMQLVANAMTRAPAA